LIVVRIAFVHCREMSDDSVVTTLQSWAEQQKIGSAKLSDDGATLALDDTVLDATHKCSITHQDKTCEYSLASMFLQILDPAQSLVLYRGACKKHKVLDPVKAVHKPTVLGFFLGEDTTLDATVTVVPVVAAVPDVAAAPAEPEPSTAAEESQVASQPDAIADKAGESKREHRHKHDKNKERRHQEKHGQKPSSSSSSSKHRPDSSRKHSSSAAPPAKKPRKGPTTIDKEKLFSNLSVVVDKRSQPSKEEEQKNKELLLALSSEGFEVTQEILQRYKETTQTLLAGEFPVGNSASILQAAAGKDLSRILKLYLDTTNAVKTAAPSSSSSKPGSSPAPGKKGFRDYLVGKKPIIVLPKGMTAPITLLNAHEFFASRNFVPREVMMKRGNSNKNAISTTFSRRVSSRLGGGTLEYELMDNPKSRLVTSKDWERVVAVVALGASWQFKDWPAQYSSPVHLFSHAFGFYIGMEGDKIPAELQGWSVVQAKLNRDKRGMDSVAYASFWNGLDEFMAIHKPELLPQDDEHNAA
jgi:parafibromin